MARQQVVQVQCDRCKRVRTVLPPPPKDEPDFHARLFGKELVYDDVCDSCRSAMENIWKDLGEWDREIKQSLLGPHIDQNAAPPMNVPPDYTPPKPHSKAAGQR